MSAGPFAPRTGPAWGRAYALLAAALCVLAGGAGLRGAWARSIAYAALGAVYWRASARAYAHGEGAADA